MNRNALINNAIAHSGKLHQRFMLMNSGVVPNEPADAPFARNMVYNRNNRSAKLSIKPNSRYAVVTCAINAEGRQMLAVSGHHMRKYAERIGADFHVIEGENKEYELAEKLRFGLYFDYYDRLIFLDADLIVADDCPNLFDIVPADSIGIHEDVDYIKPWYRENWMENEFKSLLESQGLEVSEIGTCLNTGVMVCSREHRSMFDPPTMPYPKSHTAEQSLVNINIKRQGLKLFPLKRAYNWQWWINHDVPNDERESIKICHAAGYGLWDGVSRPYWQRTDWLKLRSREVLYGLPMLSLGDSMVDYGWQPPSVAGGEWMTYAESKMVKKYAQGKDYLEFGTYAGFSAAIASQVAKSVTCIDLFDPKQFGFTSCTVKANIEPYRKCPVNFLRGDADEVCRKIYRQFDTILIDAMHNYEDVKRNIESALPLLMYGGVMLFHDDCPQFPGVTQAIKEAAGKHGLTVIEHNHSMTACMVLRIDAISKESPVDEVIPFLDANPDLTDNPPAELSGWWKWPNVQEAFRQALPRWAASTPAMPEFARLGYADHGVVMVGGGEKYEIGLFVACSMLRHHGYTGRVQLWHRGKVEPINHQVFEGLDIEIIDAFKYMEQSERTKCRRWGMWRWKEDPLNRWGGWGLKSYAVLHSPFVNVFYQDADWYLRSDVSRLHKCMELSKKHGSVIWYDNNEWGNDDELKFPLHGVPRDKEGKGFQGGQWIVNKANPTVWKALNLYRQLDNYSDYYYRHHFGDQDSMRLAWAITDCPRFSFRGRCAVRSHGYLAQDDKGYIGVHRVTDKQFNMVTTLPDEDQAHKYASHYRHVAIPHVR